MSKQNQTVVFQAINRSHASLIKILQRDEELENMVAWLNGRDMMTAWAEAPEMEWLEEVINGLPFLVGIKDRIEFWQAFDVLCPDFVPQMEEAYHEWQRSNRPYSQEASDKHNKAVDEIKHKHLPALKSMVVFVDPDEA